LLALGFGALCAAPASLHAADPVVTVASLNPDSGVGLTPCCGMNACAQFLQVTPFTYSCPTGTPVRLEAPDFVGETPFTEWRRPGHLPYTVSPTYILVPETDVTLTVVYGSPVEALPDFVVTGIALTPASPVTGLPFSVQVTVTNQGAAAQPRDASLDVWTDSAVAQECGSSGTAVRGFGSLAPGSSRVLTFTGLTAGPPGSATFRAFADTWCLVDEIDETNNQGTLPYTVRPRAVLTVSSENPANATIEVSPDDLGGQGAGTAPFSRSFDPGESVTLTAPADVGGNVFQKWRRDGADHATTRAVTVTMDSDHSLIAVYERPPSPDFQVTGITLMPAEPTAGYAFRASVTVRNKGELDGFGGKLAVWTDKVYNPSCTWEDSSQYLEVGALAAGESKTFLFDSLGPLAQGSSYHFRAYVDAACETPEGVGGDRDNDNQSTRDYLVIPGTVHTLRVETLDRRPAQIDHTMDVSGQTTGTTTFTRYFRDGATVTLTAPAATPDGGVFQKWVGLEPAVPTTRDVTFTMNSGKGLKAVYVGPGEPDFAVTAVAIDPPSPPAGTVFSATVTIANVGTGSGVPGGLRIFPDRSTPAACWAWTSYGPAYIDSLAAGSSRTYTIPEIPAGGVGAKSLLAFVDTFCETDEPEETDNQAFFPYEVVNVPPVLDAIGDRQAAEGETLSFTVAAVDANNDPLTYEATGLPAGANFDPETRTFWWTPGYDAAGLYPGVRFTVSDGEATDEETITIAVAQTNRPPVLHPVGDRGAAEGEPFALAIDADDPDGDSPIILQAWNLPAWATLDPATGVISGIPGFDQAGRHEGILLTATDPAGASTSEMIAIEVAEPAGPVFQDDFSPLPAGEGDGWLPVAGAWRRANGVYTAASGRRTGLTRISLFDPEALPLGAGVIKARVRLTGRATSLLGPNALIVFGYRDPGHYRWVRIRPGKVQIGQRGEIDGIAGGTKRSASTALHRGRWYNFTVRIERHGRVRVFKGAASRPLAVHRFAVAGAPSLLPGGVGLATSKARAYFDDVVVWEDSALGE